MAFGWMYYSTGEMFYFEDFAHECARLGKNTFFLSGMPLNGKFAISERNSKAGGLPSRKGCTVCCVEKIFLGLYSHHITKLQVPIKSREPHRNLTNFHAKGPHECFVFS